MTRQDISVSKTATEFEHLLTPREAANRLRLSESWLAKARVAGTGPPYMQFGRSIRYGENTLVRWTKSHLRLSTSNNG